MYAGSSIPPIAAGGVLASTGANTTLGITIAAIAFAIGGALFLRDRLVRRAAATR